MRKYIDIVNEAQIVELAGIKNNPDLAGFKDAFAGGWDQRGNRLIEFSKYMEKRGYTPLGSGQFGIAFTHPSIDYVVKVLGDDTNYLGFVEMCMANTDNTHLPHFKGKIIRLDEKHFIVRMEKLARLRQGTVLAEMAEIIDHYCFCLRYGGNGDETLKEMRDSGMFRPATWKRLAAEPSLFETIDMIVAKFGNANLDLHTENQMARGQALVFLDPVITQRAGA